MLDTIVIEPPQKAKASVILLHGLGASGHDFAFAVPELKLPDDHAIRFLFPHAPEQPVSLNGGHVMPAWYDIFGLGMDSKEDTQGIRRAAMWIQKLIENEEAKGILPHRIVLGGFSQGGAMALHTALRYPKSLGGVLALSTYLPVADTLSTEKSAANQQTPIWMAHGLKDLVVSMALAQYSLEYLEKLKYPVQFQTYPIAHTLSSPELKAIGQWLQQRMGA
jgi:phospholipase/carboxylesterase